MAGPQYDVPLALSSFDFTFAATTNFRESSLTRAPHNMATSSPFASPSSAFDSTGSASPSAPPTPRQPRPLPGDRRYSDNSLLAGARLANRRRATSIRGPTLPQTKIGPQRTSKVSQKLKILPSPADHDEESGRDVYSQGRKILLERISLNDPSLNVAAQ